MKVEFIPVRKTHLKRLNEIVNNADVARFLSLTPPASMKSTLEWYKGAKRSKMPWRAIVCDGKIVGSFSLHMCGSKHSRKKMGHIAVFGISIDKKYWDMGIGKRATRYAIREAKKFGFKRIELTTVKANKRAQHVYRECGFKKEGVLKKFLKIGNKYHDAIMMSQWIG